MKKEFKQILEGFLREGDEDDIYFCRIMNAVSRVLNLNDQRLTLTEADMLWNGIQELVTLMLQNGFVAGNHVRGKPLYYEAWPDQTPKGVIAKIREKWIAYKGETPDVYFLVWFRKANKTPVVRDSAGRRIG